MYSRQAYTKQLSKSAFLLYLCFLSACSLSPLPPSLLLGSVHAEHCVFGAEEIIYRRAALCICGTFWQWLSR
ncbi:hypothetical protein OG21DRAFT_917099 [Imleria badia]|nr:hypothetical protein OG21DRAFT_917099 [Imleria badia]